MINLITKGFLTDTEVKGICSSLSFFKEEEVDKLTKAEQIHLQHCVYYVSYVYHLVGQEIQNRQIDIDMDYFAFMAEDFIKAIWQQPEREDILQVLRTEIPEQTILTAIDILVRVSDEHDIYIIDDDGQKRVNQNVRLPCCNKMPFTWPWCIRNCDCC